MSMTMVDQGAIGDWIIRELRMVEAPARYQPITPHTGGSTTPAAASLVSHSGSPM